MNVYSQIGLVTLVGPDHQARHPDRRVRQPAAGARPRRSSRPWSKLGDAAAAADPDDHGRHGPGLGAAGARHGRRRREPAGDRLGDRRRPAAGHAAHALRRADRLHAAGADPSPAESPVGPAPRPPNDGHGISRVEPVVARPSSARCASAASARAKALVDLDLDGAGCHDVEQVAGAGQQQLAVAGVGHQGRPGDVERALGAEHAQLKFSTGPDALPKLTARPSGRRQSSERMNVSLPTPS